MTDALSSIAHWSQDMMQFDPRAADRILIAFAVGFLLAGGYALMRSLNQGYSGELAGANLFFVGMFCGVLAAVASTLASTMQSWFGTGKRATSLRMLLSGIGAAGLVLALIALNVGRPHLISALGFVCIIGTISAACAWIAERLRPAHAAVC